MDFVLDEKTKAALIGLMPFGEEGTMQFTPEEYTGRGIPKAAIPVFELRAFTKGEAAEIHKLIESKQFENEHIINFARIATAGWQGLYNLATGKPIKYIAADDKGANKNSFDSLPWIIVLAIWRQVAKMSGITKPDDILTEQERQGLKS